MNTNRFFMQGYSVTFTHLYEISRELAHTVISFLRYRWSKLLPHKPRVVRKPADALYLPVTASCLYQMIRPGLSFC